LALSFAITSAAAVGVACSSSGDSSSSTPSNDAGGGTDSSPSGTLDTGTGPVADTGSPGVPEASGGLLIDDMSGTTSISLAAPPGDMKGSWYTFSSDVPTSVTPNQGVPYTYTSVTPPPGVTSTHAACVSSPGFLGFAAGEGVNFAYAGTDGAPDASSSAVTYDVSKYSGIQFYAMVYGDSGPAPTVKVALQDDQTSGAYPTSKCNQNLADAEAGQCYDDFAVLQAISPTWTLVTVPWANLTQGGYGGVAGTFTAPDLAHAYDLAFQVNGAAPDAGEQPGFGFCIADLQFTP
jgi:hypothetical protein